MFAWKKFKNSCALIWWSSRLDSGGRYRGCAFHPETPLGHMQVQVQDFQSSFNAIILEFLYSKLLSLTVQASIHEWLTNLMTNRMQPVKLREISPGNRTMEPLTDVFSPHCSFPSTLMTQKTSLLHLKFADDTTIICLIRDNNESTAVRTAWKCSELWRWQWTKGKAPSAASHHHPKQHFSIHWNLQVSGIH